MRKLNLKIITPERLVFERPVNSVSLPTMNGEITILPDHIPLIAKLSSGEILAKDDSEHVPMSVVGGFLEVKKNNDVTEVTILADFAEHVSDISDEEIEKAKMRAQELKKQIENKELVNYEHFVTELERSLVKYRVASRWKSRRSPGATINIES